MNMACLRCWTLFNPHAFSESLIMKNQLRGRSLRFALAGMTVAFAVIYTQLRGASAADISDEQAFQIGQEAYVYGYPLVTMEFTRRVMTNVAKPEGCTLRWGNFCS